MSDDRLVGLVERLGEARRRTAYSGLVSGVVAGVLTALAVFCLLEALHGLFGSLRAPFDFAAIPVPASLLAWRSAPVPQHLVVAVAAGLIAFAVTFIASSFRRPEMGSIARAADRRFGMEESVSTAMEVSAARTRGSSIVDALLRNTEARSGAVDPRRLVPVEVPAWALGVPLLFALAAWLVVAPPPPLFQGSFGTSGPSLTRPATLTAEEQQTTAANLRTIATILRQDGDERADPVIQALARELDLLGNELAAGTNIDRSAVTAELDRLLSLATEAYGRAGEAAGSPRDLSRLLEGAINDLNPERAAVAAEAEAGDRPALGPDLLPDDDLPPGMQEQRLGTLNGGENPGGIPQEGRGDLPDAINREDINPGVGGGNITRVQGGPDQVDEIYGAGDEAPISPPPGAEEAGPGDGRNGGDYAGAGTRPLYGEAAPLGTPIDVAGEMALDDPDPANSRRIRLNLPPRVDFPGGGIGGAAAGAGGWQAAAEQEVTRALLPAQDRDAVSRYFQAMAAERAE